MPKLTQGQIEVVEAWVNSPVAISLVDMEGIYGTAAADHGGNAGRDIWNCWIAERWDLWLNGLNLLIICHGWRRLSLDFTDELLDDMRDWEHNGNMRVWGEDETDDFGMHRWTIDMLGS